MRNKILLVDGHELLFRMFFGLPFKVVGANGYSIHGIMGFIGTILKAAALVKPKYLLVVFDSETGSFREKEKVDYKGNRMRDWSDVDDNENPFSQLQGIHQALEYIGWKYCKILGAEADDVLAAYAGAYSEIYEIILMSHDTDLLQLVGPWVSIYHLKGSKSVKITPADVEKKYGIGPALIPDFKALAGDKTDNISGVRGIGPKTAQKLLTQFNGIDGLYKRISEVVPDKLRTSLISNKNLVVQNLSLIKLNRSIDMPHDLGSIEILPDSWNLKTMQVLKNVGVL